MSDSWTDEEVAATVADYFAMLQHELRGELFNKRERNVRLQRMLSGRSAGAIEFKHANISAVMIELGFPYIDGYKPRGNYQSILRDEILSQWSLHPALADLAAVVVSAPAQLVDGALVLSDVFVPVPMRTARTNKVNERLTREYQPRIGVNYLERESHNASLGLAGEEYVLKLEHQRLWEEGARHFAERIEHVSRTKGDGLGYDIVSFDVDGRERLIEVKTTSFGAMTPFYASRREVAVSEEKAEHYRLYRLFKFRAAPKLFVLDGSLRQSCILDPIQYSARLP